VLADVFGNYIEFLCMVMLLLALGSLIVARYLNTSKIGRGLAAIRDDEIAAGCAGVPTLKLKLLSTTISGALMGIAGAPYAYYVTFVDPASAFSLFVAVNSIAMPMIGGTTSWIGPLVGALLLGGVQQWTTVTISSELNLLVVGVMLVVFVSSRRRASSGWSKNCSAGKSADERSPVTTTQCTKPEQTLRRFQRIDRCQFSSATRRAARPDRSEWFRQNHDDQLHLRRAQQRKRHYSVPRREYQPADATAARQTGHRPQFSDPKAVHQHDGAAESENRAGIRCLR
jgi:hypothetical protein